MQKIIGIVAIAALTSALPQLAFAQSSQQGQSSPSIQQQVKDNLAQAGFTNIRILPESFLVRATDKNGNPVMMVINPDSMTEVTGMSTDQTGSKQAEANQNSAQSAKMSGSESVQNVEGGKIPGRSRGMVAELKQDESRGLNLTTHQRAEIWDQIGAKTGENAPTGFTARVGEAMPNGVQLKSLPGKVSRQVPAVKSYEYAALSGQLLIVDPSTKKIVAIITE